MHPEKLLKLRPDESWVAFRAFGAERVGKVLSVDRRARHAYLEWNVPSTGKRRGQVPAGSIFRELLPEEPRTAPPHRNGPYPCHTTRHTHHLESERDECMRSEVLPLKPGDEVVRDLLREVEPAPIDGEKKPSASMKGGIHAFGCPNREGRAVAVPAEETIPGLPSPSKLAGLASFAEKHNVLAGVPPAVESVLNGRLELIKEAADTIETLLSTEPQMPTYASTLEEAERVLAALRAVL